MAVFRALFAMGLVAVSGVAMAGAPAEPARFQAQDIFRLTQASDPQISPDGNLVAYVRITNDIMADEGLESIWLVDTRTGVQRPLGGVAAAGGAQPRWCASGKLLAFTATPKGQARGLFTYMPVSRRIERIATLASPASGVSWSPDCAKIALIMHASVPPETLGTTLVKPAGADWAKSITLTTRAMYHKDGKGDLDPGYDHVFVTSVVGGTLRQLTTGPFDDAGPVSWTPDGLSLVFTSRRDKGWETDSYRSAIYRVSLAGGALTRLTQLEGPAASATVSPDGRTIAFSGYDDRRRRPYENRKIYLMDSDGSHVRVAHEDLDRSLSTPVWAADGRSLFAALEDRGVNKVVRFEPGGIVRVVAERLADSGLDLPYSGGSFSVARSGTVAIPQGGSDHPADVAIVRDGVVERLTRLNAGLLEKRSLGALAPLKVTASDGTPIDAWVLTPPGFDRSRQYPMILEIHGGPFLHYGPYFSTDDQLYAAAGYVVVYANARGSTSYGEAFANAINRDYPGIDYSDQMSVVDAAVAQGYADPHRLFVTGGSGGGIMTAWIVGKTDRFRAAASQRPAMNWTSLALTSDAGYKVMSNWIGKTPWEDPESYWKHSPLSLISNVKTPTLVVVGEKDVRTPIAEAEQFYGALQYRGVATGLLRVPDAFHEMAARPSQSAARAEAIIGWFNRYDRQP
ncbi:S9 family peptidase [Sphingomonas sp. QA11]|uniref:S9 family peptidase n=1 Tax=Sphingomonas sp. QA11 TaxID=2950605 RepID=UPI00234AC93C|nr:S9 family peptidase [Sphingomonas sp. QA11]WCM25039.1 S9 family peptidase [Sphingomonas sp. QA11]